jgi:hypothetical protein
MYVDVHLSCSKGMKKLLDYSYILSSKRDNDISPLIRFTCVNKLISYLLIQFFNNCKFTSVIFIYSCHVCFSKIFYEYIILSIDYLFSHLYEEKNYVHNRLPHILKTNVSVEQGRSNQILRPGRNFKIRP